MTKRLCPSQHWLMVLLCVAVGLSQAGCDIQRATEPEEAEAAPGAPRAAIWPTGIRYYISVEPWGDPAWFEAGPVYSEEFTYDTEFDVKPPLDDDPALYAYFYTLHGEPGYQGPMIVAVIPEGWRCRIQLYREFLHEVQSWSRDDGPDFEVSFRTFSNPDIQFLECV